MSITLNKSILNRIFIWLTFLLALFPILTFGMRSILTIVWAVFAAVIARAVSIYGFSLFSREIPYKWKHVLFWGGLRGAIALALALSLPESGPLVAERGRLQAMAFGLVLFSLLVQGASTDWLVKRLKLIQRSTVQEEYERRHARFVAGRAAHDYIRRMSQQGIISEHTWQRLAPLSAFGLCPRSARGVIRQSLQHSMERWSAAGFRSWALMAR